MSLRACIFICLSLASFDGKCISRLLHDLAPTISCTSELNRSYRLRWCRARDLFGSQIPVTTGGFEVRISCMRSSCLTHYVIRLQDKYLGPYRIVTINLSCVKTSQFCRNSMYVTCKHVPIVLLPIEICTPYFL